MTEFRTHKVVSSLPGVLEASALYFVRVGAGYDLYVTNESGGVIAYSSNVPAHQHAVNDLSDATSAGKSLLTAANEGAQRNLLSLGSAATADSTAFEVAGAVTAHVAAADPHPQYLTPAEASAAYAPLAHVGSGGAAHAAATTSVAGFMSVADKAKLDGVAASATNTPLSSATPAALGTAAVGTGTTAARADHVHPLPTTTLTGDLTGSGAGGVPATVANNAISNAKLADVPTATIKGRTTAGAGDPEDLTSAQVRTLLNVADGASANSADATLLNRANHTGTQLAATVSDFSASVRAQIEAALAAGSNVTITPSGSGATRTLTLAAAGGGGGATATLEWLLVTAGAELGDVPVLADITAPQTFTLPAAPQPGDSYVLRSASSSTALASINPGAGRQIQGCPVAGALLLSPGDQALLICRSAGFFELAPQVLGANSITNVVPTFGQRGSSSLPRAKNKVLIGCDTAWDNYQIGNEGALDTTVKVFGNGSQRVTAPASTLAAVSLDMAGSPLNIVGHDLRFYVRCSNWAAVSALTLILGSNGYTLTNTYTVDIAARLISEPSNSWIEVVVPRSALIVDGVPNAAAINVALLRLTANSGGPVSVWIDQITGVPAGSTGLVSITFDDGYDDVFTTAKPLMDARGMPGTAYIAPSVIGSPNFMTEAQVQALSYAGWDIGGHAMTNLTSLSETDLELTLSQTSEWLNSRGLRGAEHYALPNGAYNDLVISKVRKYFATATNIDGMNNPGRHVSPFRINRQGVDRFTTPAQIANWVNQAILNGEWCILNFHTLVDPVVDDQGYTPANFATVLDQIAAAGVEVLTITDALARLTNRAGSSIGAGGAESEPGGTSGQVQINNNGAFAGAANTSTDASGRIIHGSYFDQVATGIPSAPNAGFGRWFSRPRGGRMLPHYIGPAGADIALQPALFGNSIHLWMPGTGTTVAINYGTAWTARNSGTGAVQATPARAATNALTSISRATFGTGTTATGASGIQSSSTVAWRGNAAGLGGFFYFARFGVETFRSDIQVLVGLSALNAALAGEPSVQNNSIGVCKDSTDTNWQIFTRSGTATTKTNTGVAVAAGTVLDLMMFAPPNDSTVTVRLVNAVTGAVLVDELVISTNLPVNTTFLHAQAQIRSTTGTTAALLALNRIYVENDL